MAPILQPVIPPSVNVSQFPPSQFAIKQAADVNLTSAQIRAFLTTPVTLVAAPGAGLMIIPELIVIRVHRGHGGLHGCTRGGFVLGRIDVERARGEHDFHGPRLPGRYRNRLCSSPEPPR